MAENVKRIPVNQTDKLGPGEYEIVSTLKGGDPGAITKDELQKQLRLKFGPNLSIEDWGTKGADLIIRFKIAPSAATAQSLEAPVDDPQGQVTAMFVPIVYAAIYAAAIIAALYLIWKISAEIKEVVQLVTTTTSPVGTGVALATGGVGIALIVGAGLLLWATLKRDGAGASKALGNLRAMFRGKR